MKQIILQQAHKEIDSMIFEENGSKLIRLENYCLDFSKTFVYLGMTKKGDKVILGDIDMRGPDGIHYHKKMYGQIYEREMSKVDGTTVNQIRIKTDGHRYTKTLVEVAN